MSRGILQDQKWRPKENDSWFSYMIASSNYTPFVKFTIRLWMSMLSQQPQFWKNSSRPMKRLWLFEMKQYSKQRPCTAFSSCVNYQLISYLHRFHLTIVRTMGMTQFWTWPTTFLSLSLIILFMKGEGLFVKEDVFYEPLSTSILNERHN